VPRNYLITGGAGFIGANTADRLLCAGHSVVVLDDFSRAGTELNYSWLERQHATGLSVIRADVREAGGAWCEAVAGADVVLHLAGQVAVTTSVTNPRTDFEINALGTFNVLEAARAAARPPIVIYSSTNKVYGKMSDVEVVEHECRYSYRDLANGVGEDRPLDFYSPYGCSKGAGDQYVVDYARIYGMQTVVFRQSCIYGPRQFGIEDQGWLAWFAIRALLGRGVTVYGDGKQVRDALFVDDLVSAFTQAVDRIDVASGQAYNLGGGPRNTVSLLELIDLLGRRFGKPLAHRFDDWRPGDQKVFIADIGKAERELAWRPIIGVEQGVERMLQWLDANRSEVETVIGVS